MKKYLVEASYKRDGVHFLQNHMMYQDKEPTAEDFKKYFEARFAPLVISNVEIKDVRELDRKEEEKKPAAKKSLLGGHKIKRSK